MEDFTNRIKAWLSPSLILIVAYFCKLEFEEIKAEIKSIPNLNVEIATIKANYNNLDHRVKTLETSYYTKKNYAKNEDEITVSSIK